jgi:C4-dicarboxylate-specific signal transduction histidine kinase
MTETRGDESGVEARVLSQILAAQNVLSALPDENRIAEFIKEALYLLPGVKAGWVCLRALAAPVGSGERKECRVCLGQRRLQEEGSLWKCDFEELDGFEAFLLQTSMHYYGVIVVEVADADAFVRYQDAFINFVNSVTIKLENRSQHEKLRRHAQEMDEINHNLRKEIAARQSAEESLRKTHDQLLHAEKLSALGKLTGSIAHEFNNPLTGLRNILEQVSEDSPDMDAELKDLMALGVKECHRMAALVQKLQNFYKPPHEEIYTAVNIHNVLDEIILLLQKRLLARNIQLKKNYVPDLPEIEVVEDQIKQVLLNLVQNAEDAITGERGIITITTESCSPNIRIFVQDTGQGIPDRIIQSIFDPFFTTKSAVKGTGLGLSVSHGIIKKHKGDISVQSQVGRGTVFTVTLPVKQ